MLKQVLKNINHNKNNIKYIYKDKNTFIGEEVERKNEILRYLKNFNPNYATSALVYDYVKKTEVKGLLNMGYEYDGYYWCETDVYHFEKYNMPLDDKFIEYVLSK